MERDSFIFYRSFYEAIRDLPRDIRLEVYTALMEYALYGRLPEGMKPFAKGLFMLMKPVIDTNTIRFENGCKGGRKKKSDKHAAESEALNTRPSEVKPSDVKDEASKTLPSPKLSTKPEPAATAEVTPGTTADNTNAAFLTQFFSDRRENSLATLCKNFGFKKPDIPRLRALADAVIAEWELADVRHTGFSDWSRHLISTMRRKLKDSPDEQMTTTTPVNPPDYSFNGGFGGADI